ncbi:unnamed protein product [Closterium sp. NIES-65]|nr:unnamed protein product [Closterium sp. NIES-65]
MLQIIPNRFVEAPGERPASNGASINESGAAAGRVVGGVERGRVVDWGVMEDAWRYMLYEQMGWEEGGEGAVLLCEPILTPRASRNAFQEASRLTTRLSHNKGGSHFRADREQAAAHAHSLLRLLAEPSSSRVEQAEQKSPSLQSHPPPRRTGASSAAQILFELFSWSGLFTAEQSSHRFSPVPFLRTLLSHFLSLPLLSGGQEQAAQVLFESFSCSGFFAAEQPVLALYALGRALGCCVDLGHGKTDFSVVQEGALIPPLLASNPPPILPPILPPSSHPSPHPSSHPSYNPSLLTPHLSSTRLAHSDPSRIYPLPYFSPPYTLGPSLSPSVPLCSASWAPLCPHSAHPPLHASLSAVNDSKLQRLSSDPPSSPTTRFFDSPHAVHSWPPFSQPPFHCSASLSAVNNLRLQRPSSDPPSSPTTRFFDSPHAVHSWPPSSQPPLPLQRISLGSERLEVAEALFRPSLLATTHFSHRPPRGLPLAGPDSAGIVRQLLSVVFDAAGLGGGGGGGGVGGGMGGVGGGGGSGEEGWGWKGGKAAGSLGVHCGGGGRVVPQGVGGSVSE